MPKPGLTWDDLLNPSTDPLLVGNEMVPSPPPPIPPGYPHLLLIGQGIDTRHTRSGRGRLLYLNVRTTNEKIKVNFIFRLRSQSGGNWVITGCARTRHRSELIFSSPFHSLFLPTHYHSPQIPAQIVPPTTLPML